MVVRLVGAATLIDDEVDVRSARAQDRHHPLAAIEGAFNAVMLQGDAIREITLEGPGAGSETASAVVADMAGIIGTTGTGFLQRSRAGGPSSVCRPETCGRRSTCTSKSTTSPESSPTCRSGWPRTTSPSRG